MPRIFIIFILSIYQFSSISQISLTDNTLYRYVENEIQIDNRFILDTTNSEDEFMIRLASEGEYFDKFYIKPLTKNRTIEFHLSTKDLQKNDFVQKFRLRNPKPLETTIVYPSKNGKYDITRDFKLIRFLMRSGPDVDYITHKSVTHYNVTLPDGTLYIETNLGKIDTVMYDKRPKFVIIDKIISKSGDFTFRSNDSDTIKFSYPESVDTSEWCFDSKKNIIKINEENFKNPDDTIIVENKGCLYLKLNADGTQNQFVLTSLEYDKEIIYNDIYGRPSHLVDISEEQGKFRISLVGDSSFSGTITLIIK